MTPQELKNSILQLAIQGKLVEQRPDEGTAEELYNKIQDEKQALIKAGKLKKEKPLEPIKEDEIPFDIPDNWIWIKLDGLAIKEIRRGKSPKYADFGSAFAFAQKCNSKYEGIKLDLALYLDDSSLKRYSEDEVIIDKDIIINSTGTGTMGRIGFYRETFNLRKAKYYPDSHVTVVRITKKVLPEYAIACLHYYHPWLERQGEGSTNQKELKPFTIKNLLIPLPPLAEQQRIVQKFEHLLQLVDEYEKSYTKLEALNKDFPTEIKKSILQYAIQGKLVPQDPSEGTAEELYNQIQAEKQALIKAGKLKKEKKLEPIKENEILFDIPNTWLWIKTGEIGNWSSGATPSRANPEYYNGNIPWLKTGDLNDGYVFNIPEAITKEALSIIPARINPVGSVLMAMYGATIGKLGILKIEATTNQACCACIPYKGLYNKYIFYYLMASRKMFIGLSEGGAQPNISKVKIVNFSFALPPLAEQHRIVAKIEQLFALVDKLIVK